MNPDRYLALQADAQNPVSQPVGTGWRRFLDQRADDIAMQCNSAASQIPRMFGDWTPTVLCVIGSGTVKKEHPVAGNVLRQPCGESL